jgi:AraC family transcriptional regulator of arabinose operon
VLHFDSPDIRQRVFDQLAEVNRLLHGYDARRFVLASHVLAVALLWCDQQNLSRRQAIDDRVAHAADLICRNLDRQLTLAQLADHCNLSPSRLRHLFTDQMNLSPQQFQEQQRMTRAQQLLQVSNHSVAEIAYQVGFDDPFYFSTRFKKSTGFSPRAFREKFARG